MVPTTIQALFIIIVAVIPGALFYWGYERQVGGWGVGLEDRILRFLGASAALHVLIAPLTLALWREYVQSERLRSGDFSLWLWPLALLFIVVPFAVGLLVGWGTKNRSRSRLAAALSMVSGHNTAPDAWSRLFVSAPEGWVRIRTKEGAWLGGLFYWDKQASGRQAYASGPPAKHHDLLLFPAVDLDREGNFPDLDEDDLDYGRAVWLSRDVISHMDFYYFD